MKEHAQRLSTALARLAAPLQKQDPAGWGTATRELDTLSTSANAFGKVFDGVAFSAQLRRFREAVPAAVNE